MIFLTNLNKNFKTICKKVKFGVGYLSKDKNGVLVLLIFVLYFITLPVAICGNTELSTTTTVWGELLRLFENLDEGEVIRFNDAIDALDQREQELAERQSPNTNDHFIQNVIIALTINATIILLAYYGPTIWETVTNSVQQIAEIASNTLFESARQTALNRLHNMSYEEQLAAKEIISQIIASR